MGFSLFTPTEQTTQQAIDLHNTLFEPLNDFAQENGIQAFFSSTMFYRKEQLTPCYLLFEATRGICLFDAKLWEYSELANATVEPALDPNVRHDINVNKPHAFIEQKFDALLHHEASPVVNFLYLPRLKREEFESLDASFHQLLPRSRILFADDDHGVIRQKLNDALPLLDSPLDEAMIIGGLYFQYVLLPDNMHDHITLLNAGQRHYIDMSLPTRSVLVGTYGSGKSSLLLMKTIVEKLRHPEKSITLIEPSHAACEFLKQRLLQIMEYAMIDLDPLAIEIVTPEQFINHNHAVDMLFCDDAHLLSANLVEHFERIQLKKQIHYASIDDKHIAYQPILLEDSYRCPQKINLYCSTGKMDEEENNGLHIAKGNAYVHILHLLPKLLEEVTEDQILIAVPDRQFAEKLQSEIEGFLALTPTLFDADDHILYQEIDHLIITPIEHTNGLQRDYVIVVSNTPEDEQSPWICHALGRAHKAAYLITDTEITRSELS